MAGYLLETDQFRHRRPDELIAVAVLISGQLKTPADAEKMIEKLIAKMETGEPVSLSEQILVACFQSAAIDVFKRVVGTKGLQQLEGGYVVVPWMAEDREELFAKTIGNVNNFILWLGSFSPTG